MSNGQTSHEEEVLKQWFEERGITEVECMGNCSSAPMVQINDDNYEDLTYDRTIAILDALAKGEQPKTGTQEPGRHTVEPLGGPTTLKAMVTENHDYRGEWA